MRPKVAIYLPSLSGGGAERVMVSLANAIGERGYGVDLILASAQGPYLENVSNRVRIINLKASRVLRSLLPLVRYLRCEQPAALLSAMNHANVVAVMANLLAKTAIRLVVSEHTTISIGAARVTDLSARLVYKLVPPLYRRADAVVAVSQDAARDLMQFTGLSAASVRTIYNPFDLIRIERLAAEPLPHSWFAPGQPPVILAIGRLAEEKDFPTLIRAFATIRARHNARLLILGEGALRGALEALGEECSLNSNEIQMPGFVANPFAYMARAAVFVLSSRWEGLPGVLIEAMACGVPVISTDCPSGPQEILEGGRWGRLVPTEDVGALAQAMDEVLATPMDQLPDVRQRARDFDQECAVDAYLDALGLPPRPRGNA